ncbi:acetylornithine/succinylornithine family transaminase [Thiospirochaeta perfilievii]|uniref:Acetylornithine/succinylornithine family transaminase n=1 Tax=Thiospirochaeta perfilievii TaxID=252967 RepID=A0A5C1QA89_9SPIO|nr:acetylornithine/succinylornithine family transaminase [Thiospirochaeta perfilievii]QEN04258.1 acetylornithine/succinylornithine family transaminase [Thiospirochaeta perfilievii]
MSPFVNKPPYPNNYGSDFLVLDRGEGCYIFDKKGNKYLDFGSGISVNALGYGREDLADIAYKQMKKLIHTSNLYATEPALELATKLCKTGNFAAVHFGNSGTEANEAAFKYARAYSQRVKGEGNYKILSFSNAFHGRTFGTMSATPKEKYKAPFYPLVPGFETAEYNSVDDLKKILDSSFAAVIVEPLQGEGGLDSLTKEFCEALHEICLAKDILIISDEVQTGFGRTGELYGYETFGLKPDIITLSKPLAGGLPLSATLIPKKVNDLIKIGEHGTTFGGGPVTTAVALKVMSIINDKEFLDNIKELSSYFKSGLEDIIISCSSALKVKGEGLLLGLQLANPNLIPTVINKCRESGLLILRTGSDSLRFAPPLNITKEEIKTGLDILKKAL